MRPARAIRNCVYATAYVLVGSLLTLGCTASSAASSPSACPVTGAGSYQSCVQVPASGSPAVGQEITAGTGSDPGTPWMVTDPSGAPIAWVNLYGLYSGGDGGKMPGGLICVTNGVTAVVACLTPEGTLTLQPPGAVHGLRSGRRGGCDPGHASAGAAAAEVGVLMPGDRDPDPGPETAHEHADGNGRAEYPGAGFLELADPAFVIGDGLQLLVDDGH